MGNSTTKYDTIDITNIINKVKKKYKIKHVSVSIPCQKDDDKNIAQFRATNLQQNRVSVIQNSLSESHSGRVRGTSPHVTSKLINKSKVCHGVEFGTSTLLYLGDSNDIYINYRVKDNKYTQVILVLGSIHIHGVKKNMYWVFDKVSHIPMFKMKIPVYVEITRPRKSDGQYVFVKYSVLPITDVIFKEYENKSIQSGEYIFGNDIVY